MNARKAVLADNPELILRVLQLRFDELLSYPHISCSGQLILATRPDCSWNSHSDSFGVKPPLYQWGRMAL
ncbi:transposase [Escherichia coli]|nr:transposase [Escherichia coli]